MVRREVELIIKKNVHRLTRHQVQTLKGQLNKEDIDGAYKGLRRILRKLGV